MVEVPEAEYSREFDELRKNRVAMGLIKYGPVAENYGKAYVDALSSAMLCFSKYKLSRNTEYLLDAANYIMFEWMHPQVEGAHFTPTEAKDSAGIVGMPVNEARELYQQEEVV